MRHEVSEAAEMADQQRRDRDELMSVLAERRFYPVYQPIIEFGTGQTVGFEALTRFTSGFSMRPPNLWFDQAWRAGVGLDFELAAVRLAIEHGAALPANVFLSINCSASLIASSELLDALAPATRPLVIELTEHDRVADYDTLRGALARIRDNEVRLAVDDAGAGFSSLRHILRLSPDYIKLDTELTRGIHSDAVRRSLGKALVAFAAETGATLIAEGVESRDEKETLRALGVHLGQGDFFARPERIRTSAQPKVS